MDNSSVGVTCGLFWGVSGAEAWERWTAFSHTEEKNILWCQHVLQCLFMWVLFVCQRLTNADNLGILEESLTLYKLNCRYLKSAVMCSLTDWGCKNIAGKLVLRDSLFLRIRQIIEQQRAVPDVSADGGIA